MKKIYLICILSLFFGTLSYSQNDLILLSRGRVIDSVRCKILVNSVDTITYLFGGQRYRISCDSPSFTALIKPDKHIEYGVKLLMVRFYQSHESGNSIADLFPIHRKSSVQPHINLFWFGLDFSKVNVTLGIAPRSQYSQLFFLDCNDFILSVKGFQKFKDAFNFILDTGTVTRRNARVDPSLSFNSVPKPFPVDSIRETLKQFGSANDGIGVVVFITSINKEKETETYDVVFFDIKTKSLILCLHEQTPVKGIGMAHHWTNFIRDYLDLFVSKKIWIKRYSG